MTDNVVATPPPDRVDPPLVADERTMLDAWLDFHRATLLQKCAGLDGTQLATRSVAASGLSLLGLVRHMTDNERGWFGEFAGVDDLDVYGTPDRPDASFDDADPWRAEADLAAYRAEVEVCRRLIAGHDLDEQREVARQGSVFSLRWIYVHMLEEYARHNGHADLLRESIDGATGD